MSTDHLWNDPDGESRDLPDCIGIDANGYGWRAWDDADHLSMVSTNPDNEPIPEPMTWFVREDDSAVTVLGEVVDWLGVPDWTGPQMPESLGRRIARVLERSPAPVPAWTCPRCGSPRWVAAAFYPGGPRTKQCVPCGHYSDDGVADDERPHFGRTENQR